MTESADVRAPATPTPMTRVPLRLPDGRLIEVEGDPADLSVVGALASSNGSWEPHVGAVFRRVVPRGGVCLDLGANIGAHALGLAVLAGPEGTVVAFEPGPTNGAFLTRNLAALQPPCARTHVVRVALWDEPGEIAMAAISELAGCAFVAPRPTEGPPGGEALIRSVVTGEAVSSMPLNVTIETVPALRLDDWMASATEAPARVDVVKLDVEGAEPRVLRGAASTLARHRPVLITEYNPATARAYFDAEPQAYFQLLAGLYESVSLIEPEGALTLLPNWEALATRLDTGRGWEDLLCLPTGRFMPI